MAIPVLPGIAQAECKGVLCNLPLLFTNAPDLRIKFILFTFADSNYITEEQNSQRSRPNKYTTIYWCLNFKIL